MGYNAMERKYKPINATNDNIQSSNKIIKEVKKILNRDRDTTSNISDLYGAIAGNVISTGYGYKKSIKSRRLKKLDYKIKLPAHHFNLLRIVADPSGFGIFRYP